MSKTLIPGVMVGIGTKIDNGKTEGFVTISFGDETGTMFLPEMQARFLADQLLSAANSLWPVEEVDPVKE